MKMGRVVVCALVAFSVAGCPHKKPVTPIPPAPVATRLQVLSQGKGKYLVSYTGKIKIKDVDPFHGGGRCQSKLVFHDAHEATMLPLPNNVQSTTGPTEVRVMSCDKCEDDGKCRTFGEDGWPKGCAEGQTCASATFRIPGNGDVGEGHVVFEVWTDPTP